MGKRGRSGECKEVGQGIQRKIECRSKKTGKGRNRKKNKRKPKNREIQKKQTTREVHSKAAVQLG